MIAGALILAACNTGASDATRIIDSNVNGTISAFQSQATSMSATIVAVGTTTINLGRARDDLATEHAKYLDLLAQANLSTPLPPDSSTSGTQQPAGNTTLVPTVAGTTTGPDLTLDAPVLARSIDGNGCAINPTTTFSGNDAKIHVVTKAHNLKKGVLFTASWNGALTHQDTWTSNYAAAQLCIHFYVVPKVLNMTDGNWTVSISAPNVATAATSFTITTVSATAAPTKTG